MDIFIQHIFLFQERRIMAPSPVAKLKCVKNSAEIEGMKLAQVILRTINYEIRN